MNQSAKELLSELKQGIAKLRELTLAGESDWAVYEEQCYLNALPELINELTYFLDTQPQLYIASSKGSQLCAMIETLEDLKQDYLKVELYIMGLLLNMSDKELDDHVDYMVATVNIL